MKKFIVLIFLIIFLGVSIYAAVNFLGNDNKKIKDIIKKDEYKEYKAGDFIKFQERNWYVMYDSDKKSDYVTLITADLLTLQDEGLGTVLNGIYESSELNKYLKNNYTDELGQNNLVEINGYKVRLFNQDDFNHLLKGEYDEEKDEYTLTECPEYICQTNSTYATMIDTNSDVELEDVYLNVDDIEDPLYDEYQLHLKYYNISSTYETHKMKSITDTTALFIRPVINVYKSSLE